MKPFNWQELLVHHPIWGCLRTSEIPHLLTDEVSTEQTYAQGEIILRAGDPGDSLFLIGAGSVEVVQAGQEGQALSLTVLGPGDFFGEIAMMGTQIRSATIVAQTLCVLLEIMGQAFCDVAAQHPEIQTQVYATRQERLQYSARGQLG